MEIIPGVHAINKLGIGRAYLYAEADKLTLIDSGLPNSAGKIFAAIEALGRKPEDVRQVIITHYHNDHAGSLADVVDRSGAQVLAHPLDAPVLRGERLPAPANTNAIMKRLLNATDPGLHAPRAVQVSREVNDGDGVELDGGARIIHTPGHTPGSISIYLPQRRLLFAGDAAANLLGVRPPVGWFTEDRAAALASIRKLAELDFDVALFGHGRPLGKEASRAFRKLAEKLAK
jgi:glyoxylase-like metal-dependent hydrolase (beta-lactamase superfamily II)